MRILYGVQGTGNGHVSRARAMARALAGHPGIRVDWLFSGRPREGFFDMAVFGDYLWREGLSFAVRGGRIHSWATVCQSRPLTLIRDIRQLPVDQYDLIVSDFEPVTAWAGRFARRRVVGIGHQYAFKHDIPVAGRDPIGRLILEHFAPVALPVGLHWHHFGHSILPPIVDLASDLRSQPGNGDIVVYLPFEAPADILRLLASQPGTRFVMYHPAAQNGQIGNVATPPPSTVAFKRDLARCSGVICSAGFELIAEALSLGKRILAKPVGGQMEQLSNARALRELQYGEVMPRLDPALLQRWLAAPGRTVRITWPDSAGALAAWLADGCQQGVPTLSARLWLDAACNPVSHALAPSPA